MGTVNSREELKGILALQKQNLPDKLSKEERKTEGFVTVSHTMELLQRMNNVCPHIIAKDKDKVVGYTLCMHPGFADEIPVLQPMFKEINKVLPKEKKFMVMGQVCIDKSYRKQGVFGRLYQAMKKTIQPEFDSIITEVDALNVRSLNAHYAVGFYDLKKYHSLGQDWHLLIWE